MDWFPLAIFPEGGLSASVIVTVWVGIAVVCITNLRLGWVLSGLVVPGYIVPLLIVKPTAAIVVFLEAVVSYFAVWLYSERLSRWTGLSSFFGRDRFFALVLASVAVRIVADGWLLPATGEFLLARYDIAFDYRSNLHSFGLIIVALIANNFWKPGLVSGSWTMAVQVGLTWLIVRFVLMEFTNFNMASLAFMYEDTATSFLAAPKAYIILLVTAFIASRLNLFYGWDFSGILIPSLLALAWFEPHKIITTLLETAIILALASLALRLPVFRSMTMEGARKLLLFFNLSFAYKYVLAWALVLFLPQTKITDWFGFGYILATLLALKMHEKGIAARVTAATIQTSAAGIAVATVVGFVLVATPDLAWVSPTDSARAAVAPMKPEPRDIETVVLAEKTGFYAASLGSRMQTPLQRELDGFAAGVRNLLEFRRSRDPTVLAAARQALLTAHYEVVEVEGTYLLLRPQPAARAWGSYAFRLDGTSQLLVSVPAPVDEVGAFEAGARIFAVAQARAFATAGSARQVKDDGSSDVLLWPQTIFQVFHRELAPREVLQVRKRNSGDTVLHLSREIPIGISLRQFEHSGVALKVEFASGPERNLQRQTLRGNFAELWLSPADAFRVARLGADPQYDPRERLTQSVAALIRESVTPATVAAPGSGLYRARAHEELLRIDREVISPLLGMAASGTGQNRDAWSAFAGCVASAQAMGLQVRWLVDNAGEYFLMADRTNANGWMVIRFGRGLGYVIEAPRPIVEPGILEVSLAAFSDLPARAIILGGAAPDANKDGTADILARSNAQSLFTLAHQVTLREMGDAPGLAMMVRAFGIRPGEPTPHEDAVLAFDVTVPAAQLLPELSNALITTLQKAGLTLRIGGGAADTAGNEASGGPQTSYISQTRNKRFAVLWVSPLTRHQMDAEAASLQQRQFTALGLVTRQGDAASVLAGLRMSSRTMPPEVKLQAERYGITEDIVVLDGLKRRHSELRLERLDDTAGRGAFLIIADAAGIRGAMSLAPRATSSEVRVQPGPIDHVDSQRFVAARARWLVVQ